MSDMSIAIICITIIVWIVAKTYSNVKKITANVYQMTVNPEPPKPKSPFGLSRQRNEHEKWGYCITKNGELIFDDGGKAAIVYSDLKSAMFDMNILEVLEGYEKTKLK